VLGGGGLHTEARRKLVQSAALDAAALIATTATTRNALINQAIALKNAARAGMVF
jgi:hypothetical protein